MGAASESESWWVLQGPARRQGAWGAHGGPEGGGGGRGGWVGTE